MRLYQKFVSDEKQQATELDSRSPSVAFPPKARTKRARKRYRRRSRRFCSRPGRSLPSCRLATPRTFRCGRSSYAPRCKKFHRTYGRLGIRFDHELGESFTTIACPPSSRICCDWAWRSRSQGAIICPVEGAPAPLLVRKADGAFLYGTTDIATVVHRRTTWQPSRVLYVVGSPQQLHFRQVFTVSLAYLARLGREQ